MSKGGLAGLSVNFNLSSFGCKIILLLGLRIYQWLDLRAFTFRTFSVGPSSQILSCQSRVLPDNVAGIPSRRNLEYKETPNDIKPWETNDCDSQTTMTVRGPLGTERCSPLRAETWDMRPWRSVWPHLESRNPDGKERQKDYTPDVKTHKRFHNLFY